LDVTSATLRKTNLSVTDERDGSLPAGPAVPEPQSGPASESSPSNPPDLPSQSASHQSEGQAEAAQSNYSFEWFSSLSLYREANRAQLEAFLSNVRLAPPWQGVDVACGVGLMTELTHEIAQKVGSFIQRMVCVDLDLDALHIARGKLSQAPADFLQAVGQRLPLRDGWGSFLTLGNGIHNFGAEDKASLFGEAFRVLKGGASIFFNSAFYEGSTLPGTERFYTEKARRAIRLIGRDAVRLDDQGKHPEAARPISADEYIRLAKNAGFTDVQRHEVSVPLDAELWEAICSYGQYAQGALHFRYDVETSVKALAQAVREIFSDPDWDSKYPGMTQDGKRVIPRQWLWVTACKPA
jgi:ubiquinone/menaquinone biosynthesis C-methylase UbiE